MADVKEGEGEEEGEEVVSYFHTDFILEDWVAEAGCKFTLPPIHDDIGQSNGAKNKSAADVDDAGDADDTSVGAAAHSGPSSLSPPSIFDTTCGSSAMIDSSRESEHWGKFYTSHSSARVYKPRRYIYTEFYEYFKRSVDISTDSYDGATGDNAFGNSSPATTFTTVSSSSPSSSSTAAIITVFEVGCAHGCTIFPLLDKFPPSTRFIATDFCPQALEVFKCNALYDKSRISLHTFDLCSNAEQAPPSLPSFSSCSDFLLATFVLSAINPRYFGIAFRNMNMICKRGSYVLFRDYALHDLTMYRHKRRCGERLFRRADNTYAFYFTKEDIHQLAAMNGFVVEDIYYATVLNKNRKTDASMHRVFLHAVLRKVAEL